MKSHGAIYHAGNRGDHRQSSHDYVYNPGNQRTQQVFTAGNYLNYTYDKIGQLKTALGKEPGGTTNRWQEQFGYAYDAAGNLNWRTNYTLLQAFNVNNLNELTTVTNNGRLTVAGTTTSPATNVTVNTSNAFVYADTMFASTNQPWVNGNNTYTAIAKDGYGRKDTNSLTVNLLVTNAYAYDLNGNLTVKSTQILDYDDENQLIRITEPGKWKSEFAYDGKMRRRIRKEYVSSSGPVASPLVTAVSLSATVRNDFTGWVGYKFTVGGAPLPVSELGRWVKSGNSGTHTVKLVDASGSDIPGGSVTVATSGATAGAFAYAALANPITLSANTTYILVSQEVSGGDQWYDWNGALTTGGAATIVSTAHANNGSTTYSVTASGSYGYVPVNLKYTDGTWQLTNEVHYVYDGNLVIQERDASNLPQVTYTRGTDLSHSLQGAGGIGGLLARTENGPLIGGSPTATAFYHADGNGNITALIYTNQLIAAKYEYDPYGNMLSQSGALADANLYRFSSKEIHLNSGLVYYLYRLYDGGLQRWVNRDPLTELGFIWLTSQRLYSAVTEYNLSTFVNNDPVGKIDSFGLWYDTPSNYYRHCGELNAFGTDKYCECLCAPITTSENAKS